MEIDNEGGDQNDEVGGERNDDVFNDMISPVLLTWSLLL